MGGAASIINSCRYGTLTIKRTIHPLIIKTIETAAFAHLCQKYSLT